MVYYIFSALSFISLFLFYRTGTSRFVDIPNERSMHEKPVKRSAGVFIFFFFLGAISLAFSWNNISRNIYLFFAVGTFFLTILGLFDDLKNPSSLFKLIIEFVFFLPLFYLFPVNVSFFYIPIQNPYLVIVLASLYTLFVVNLCNFMDGMDLYLSGVCLLFFFNMFTLFGLQNEQMYIVYFCLLACIVPFYFFNFPNAKLFLGDAGSLPIGFLIASLPFYFLPSNYSGTDGFDFVYSLALVPFFWVDGIITIVRRILKKENILLAHREHLYQRIQLGYLSKKKTISLFLFLNFMPFLLGLVFFRMIPGLSKLQFSLIVVLICILIYTLLSYLLYRFNHKNLKSSSDYPQ